MTLARRRKHHLQLSLAKVARKLDKNQQFRGGTHKRSGRPKRGVRASERHKVRPALNASHPVHVIVRAVAGLGSLRNPHAFAAIKEAIHATFKLEETFRIVHFSIQRAHIHLIVEASDRLLLGKGMQVFGISAAKHINATLRGPDGKRRRGSVFADRYHAVMLRSPTQVRNTICYVLNNWRHHHEENQKFRYAWLVDPYSTAVTFAGWMEVIERRRRLDPPASYVAASMVAGRTWLLNVGWKKLGPISIFKVPGGIE